MDQFIVSARKYRPSTFDDVVGQHHIAETLKNAIKSGHLAQAFLFSGPRGVGKTTCARILAKTINCFNRTSNTDACEKCESCESFNSGHSLNVYELDAASNNSVDDIRTLIDQVRFAPQLGTKKVYIIDEVHMLSQQAFNAFLKTLEEPPSHAIFILATTEKHKIIPTILSRCQIFDFNRIEIEDMVRRLAEISEKENVKSETDALHLIAQKSDGSLRDALSMFDQMVTYSGSDLTYASVVENLSILGTDYFFDLTDFLVRGDTASSLLLFNEVLRKGFDGHNFLLGLAEHMRNLLVAQDHSTIELLLAGPQIKEKFARQTQVVSSAFLIRALNLISQAELSYKLAKNQRLLVELNLINLASLAGHNDQPSEKKVAEPVKTEAKKKSPEVSPIPNPSVKSASAVVEKKEVKSETEISGIQKEKIKESEVNVIPQAITPVPEIKPLTKQSGKRNFQAEKITNSISINSFTNVVKEIEVEKNVAENEIRYTESVTDEKLDKVWNELLKNYDRKEKLSLFATLSKYKPKLVDGTHIEITYDNKAQAQSINAEKLNIMEFLRPALKNDLLQLKLVISENTEQRAYTPHEKLEKMIKNNPNINLLKTKLDLDLN